MSRALVIGSRGSKLALWQAEQARQRLLDLKRDTFFITSKADEQSSSVGRDSQLICKRRRYDLCRYWKETRLDNLTCTFS